MGATIHFQVDLVIQLVDTTTGASVGGSVAFFKNEESLSVISGGGGNFIVINSEREDFTLSVEARGYEKCELEVNYEALDENLPIQIVFLIPLEDSGYGENVLSLIGNLDGIESVEGVNLNRQYCSISDFNEKKLEMSVFRSQGILNMDDVFYGLIKDRTSYERFEVVKKIADSKVSVRAKLNNEFRVNAPIARVIFGMVKDDKYIFRVRDDASVLEYLIRYVVNGEEHFKLVNFHEPETLSLT